MVYWSYGQITGMTSKVRAQLRGWLLCNLTNFIISKDPRPGCFACWQAICTRNMSLSNVCEKLVIHNHSTQHNAIIRPNCKWVRDTTNTHGTHSHILRAIICQGRLHYEEPHRLGFGLFPEGAGGLASPLSCHLPVADITQWERPSALPTPGAPDGAFHAPTMTSHHFTINCLIYLRPTAYQIYYIKIYEKEPREDGRRVPARTRLWGSSSKNHQGMTTNPSDQLGTHRRSPKGPTPTREQHHTHPIMVYVDTTQSFIPIIKSEQYIGRHDIMPGFKRPKRTQIGTPASKHHTNNPNCFSSKANYYRPHWSPSNTPARMLSKTSKNATLHRHSASATLSKELQQCTVR